MAVAASVILAAVFVVASVTKLAAPAAWVGQAGGLGVPRPIALVVPVVEAVLGAWLLVQWERRAAAIAAAVVIAAFSALIVVRLAQGRRPPCACFGSLSARPLGPGSLVRNAALLVVAMLAMA
jgi:hypothetical protein